jgi:hypothetical protein
MESKSLVRIVRAVASHVSKDVTRRNITCLAVTSDRRIEATDGHRAIRVDTDPPHGLPVGLYDAKKLIALLKADVMPIAADAPLLNWPTLDSVIPKREENATVRALHVNPLYLAQSAEALADVVDDKRAPVRFQTGADDLDPIRLDVAGPLASALAVIMPVCA